MLGKRIINTGGVSCTTDTTQILDAGTTQSTALYRFEDNANDTSNSTGKFGKGAVFNGSDSKITISGNPFNLTTYSLSFWIYADDYNQSNASIVNIGLDNTGGVWSGLAYGVNSNKVFYYGGDVTGVGGTGFFTQTGTTNLTNGAWTHIAIVVNGTAITGYIDGTQDSGLSRTLGANITYRAGSINTIGVRQGAFGSYGWWNGNVDELRVYNDALTATEIGYIANNTTASIPTANLIAFYSFEGNANDSTSNNNNGTASNVRYDYSGTASNITYATGKFNKGAVFNGSNSVIDIENMRTVMGNNFTVSLWVKTPSTFASSGYPAVLSMYGYTGSGSAYGWDIEYNNSNKLSFYWVSSSGVGNYIQSSALSADTWYHVVAQKDSSSANLYINGQLDNDSSSISGNGLYYNNFNRMTIGAKRLNYGSTSGHISGMVDQVRLFTKKLNAGEINSLYNETTTSAAIATINNPSTIAYYKMADAFDETDSYNGTPSNVDFNVQGKYGFAGKFNGSSSLIAIGSPIPNTDTNVAISAWVKLNSGISGNMHITGTGITSAGSEAPFRATLQYQSANTFRLFALRQVAGTYYLADNSTLTDVTMNAGVWYHVVWSYNSTGRQLSTFLNGVAIDSNKAMSTSGSSVDDSTTVIGSFRSTSGPFFDGDIDQLRIFNKTISAAEVTKLYNEIQCANTIDTPESYFNTKLYTGNGSTQALTGVGFAPAFVWIKARSVGYSHSLQDTVRGPGTGTSLYSDLQSAQGTYGSYGQISAFGTDGFTVASGGHGTYPTAQVNQNGVTYASWNWKGASSSVTNNVGTITSTVSASPESGFSIVKYTATGTIITNTVGHGLTTRPSLIIQKGANTTSNWFPITDVIDGSVDYLMLNSNGAKGDMSGIYADFSINDTTFTNWYSNTSGEIITYCFANVDGYQRIGSYTGNGSANGPFIYTGFEPAWIMIKRTDAAGAWNIFDNKRNSANPRNSILQANVADQEYTNTNYNINFYTNGFQFLNSTADWNASGGSYIFMAIAANPDTTAPTKANSFKTKIYTGTGSTHAITGLGFKPDFIWTRNRDTTDSSALVDSVRGIVSPAPYLASDANSANATSTNMPTSVQADGYTITGAGGRTNTNGEDYVSWNWKAADHDRNLATINNDGNITSAVSANRAAGFSIITYSPNDTVGMTVGHGLSQAPQIVFSKRLDSAQDWGVYTNVSTGNTTTNWLSLNDTDAYGSGSFMTLNPTTLELPQTGAFWGYGTKQIAYCYHSVTGHSSIGQYTGSGASGKTVTVGFEPSWVLIKNATSAGLSWSIWDNQRSPSNPRNLAAWADYAGGDYTQTNGLNFNSTSFELVNAANWLNKSGDTFIYMAFK